MALTSLIILTGCNKSGLDRGTSENLYGNLLDMANTISPIVNEVCDNLCETPDMEISIREPEDKWDVTKWARGSDLIYKRETARNFNFGCSGMNSIGNVYYCRCYKWDYVDGELYYHAVKDIPLNDLFNRTVYSCGSESDLLIPYYNKELAEMELGDTRKV